MPVGERRLLEPSELWPQEQQLCVKAAEGRLLDLCCRRRGEDNPARGREWGPQRRIRAQVVFQLLTGDGPKLADSVVAVRLRGAQIVGRLNLGGQKLRCPLELNQCHVGHRLDLAKAEAPNVSLRGSHLQSGLSARRLRVAHTFNLIGSRCEGGVALSAAHISGQLFCVEAVFTNPDGNALNADWLVVDAGMFLGKAQCTGQVRLGGAHISGQLACIEAVFTNPTGDALSGAWLVVDAGMYLGKTQLAVSTRSGPGVLYGLIRDRRDGLPRPRFHLCSRPARPPSRAAPYRHSWSCETRSTEHPRRTRTSVRSTTRAESPK